MGDTDDTLTVYGVFPAVKITSFTAIATDGAHKISTTFVFGWNSVGGIAGFLNTSNSRTGFTFQSAGLINFDGISDLAPIATTAFLTNAQFQTDRSFITLKGQGAGTFSAAMSGVPEPATRGLMILGFGAVGGAMRRRRSVAARVRFS